MNNQQKKLEEDVNFIDWDKEFDKLIAEYKKSEYDQFKIKNIKYYINEDYTVARSSHPADYLMDASRLSRIRLKDRAYVNIGKYKIYSKIMSFDVVKRQVTVKIYNNNILSCILPENLIQINCVNNKFITVSVDRVSVIRKEYSRYYKINN